MKHLFVDTANIDEIKEANSMGVIRGVTTNPSIIAKEPKGDFDALTETLASYCGENNLSLSVEVFATEVDQIIKQSIAINERLSPLCSNLYIKIPIGIDELKAIKTLSKNGVLVNCTCCYTEQQMNLAVLAGAKYVSLFYARLRDIGGNPNSVLERTANFIKQNNSDAKIIAGSIRTSIEAVDAWNSGCHIVTTGFSTIKSMAGHPQTKASVDKFMEDFKNWRA
jgi:transaldolase